MRPIRLLLATLALLAGLPARAPADVPTCTGTNVLEELQHIDAGSHARVLATAAATENARAILWKIEKPGAAPSHLFGTMHLTDDRINLLSPSVKSALAGSQRLVLELDDLSPDGFLKLLAGSPELLGLMLFTDGRGLDQILGPEDFKTVSDALSRSGVPAVGAGSFRPWLATMMLSISGCEQRRMTAGLLPLDLRLAKETEQRGVKVLGLETLESQFRALASVPETDQVEMLKASARLYDRIDDFMETMVQLYLRRDLGAIWPLQLALAARVGVAPDVFESVEQSLLVVRNRAMRDKALAHLEQGNAFIAVGALHLPGKLGLVTLLREAGYTLTAIE
jgi:uncharacterized protein YbaP (TraB family)